MRKTLATLALVTTLATAGTIYPTTGIMTTEDTFTTATGMEYVIDNPKDLEPGDIVSVLMFDNFTDDITDDIIITVRYSGALEHFAYWERSIEQ